MSQPNYTSVHNIWDNLNVSDIVFESEYSTSKATINYCCHNMIYVTAGAGLIKIGNDEEKLYKGCLVIALPKSNWSITDIKDLKCVCISYFGSDAEKLAMRLSNEESVKLYRDLDSLMPMWKSCIQLPTATAKLRCKGLIYYTYSELENLMNRVSLISSETNTADIIKSFIDSNFCNSEISLNYISEQLSYHANYISSVFKREFNINVSKYINILRVRYSCLLMEQGMTVVSEIALKCGYDNIDYFSYVFKAQLGVTPKNYIDHLKKTRDFFY